jgi:hypothetical protein
VSWLWGLALVVLTGCAGELTAIPDTTTRVGEPVVERGTELELKIFTTLADCRSQVSPDDVHLCMPYVDRANGEVRLGFQFRLDGDPFQLPLTEDHIKIGHLGRELQGGGANTVKVIPHDPERSAQLFVLLIDGSSSMRKGGRMEKVRKALLMPEVVKAFFPDDVKTGVVVFQFTDRGPVPLGGRLQVYESRRDFRQAIRSQLGVLSGYTHLFDAIKYATGEFLQRSDIQDLLTLHQMTPTVVALTDGFNNLRASDTCGDNADRLESLLSHLEAVRAPDSGTDPRRRPSVYTVGLGRPLRPAFKLREVTTSVNPGTLCGRRKINRRINGDLENKGIDNASLEWIARVGGGQSYVRQDRRGLGQAFQGAAAARYNWFEVRYRIHSFYLRRSFKTTLKLVSFATAEASVELSPSAWVDAPPGLKGEGGWSVQRPFRAILVLLLPAFGMLLVLSYLGAAVTNAKRAMFMHVRKPVHPGQAAPQSPPPPPPSAPDGGEV